MMYFSNTSTLAPFSTNLAAVVSPPMPLPMTIASHTLSLCSLRKRLLRFANFSDPLVAAADDACVRVA